MNIAAVIYTCTASSKSIAPAAAGLGIEDAALLSAHVLPLIQNAACQRSGPFLLRDCRVKDNEENNAANRLVKRHPGYSWVNSAAVVKQTLDPYHQMR